MIKLSHCVFCKWKCNSNLRPTAITAMRKLLKCTTCFLSVQRRQNHNYRNCILEQTVHDQCSLYIVVAFIRMLICINSDLIQVVCMMAPLACQNTIPAWCLKSKHESPSHPVTPIRQLLALQVHGFDWSIGPIFYFMTGMIWFSGGLLHLQKAWQKDIYIYTIKIQSTSWFIYL